MKNSERRRWNDGSNIDFYPSYMVKNKAPALGQVEEHTNKLYHDSNQNALEANDDLRLLVSRLIQLEQDKQLMEDEVAEIKLQLMQAIGEHEALTFDNQPLVTWKSHKRRDFDTHRFKEDRPELYEKYIRTSERRMFKLC